MKSLQAPKLKTIELTKVMYTATRMYVNEEFDDISEGRKKNV